MAMKKNYLFFGLSILAFASCSSDNDEVVVDEKMETVSFSVSSSADTRAYWSANAIYWNESDAVKVYATHHTDGSTFTLSGNFDANQSTQTFTGSTYTTSTLHDHSYYVIYPASSAKEFNGVDKVKVEIPSYQTAIKGSFASNACVQACKSGNLDYSVQLTNVCAFLKIEVTAPCEYVKVSGGDYGVAGIAWIDGNGEIKSEDWVTKLTTVTLRNLSEAGTYLIAIAPSSKYPRLDVEVKYPNIDAKTNSATNVPIVRGVVYDLGTCPGPVIGQ